MYKMLVLDLDGTLLNESQEISAGNKTAIEKALAKGIKVVLASGRSFEGIHTYNEQLHLNQKGLYTISCCGALTIDNVSYAELFSIPIEHSDLLQILNMCEEYDLDMSAYSRDKILIQTDHLFSKYDAIVNNSPLIKTDFHHLPDDLKLYKINLVNEAPQIRDAIVNYFPKLTISDVSMREKLNFNPNFLDEIEHFPAHIKESYTIVKALPFVVEILKKECNKSVAVEALAKEYGIKQSEIICIGDSGNDVHMIEYAGLGVAMANAFEEVKAVADVITRSNNDDGVAHIINKYLL